MQRLTSDKDVKDMGMFELAYNSCYEKDGAIRHRGYDFDVDIRRLTIHLLEKYAGIPNEFECDEDFDRQMMDYWQHGLDDPKGLIAAFHLNLWAIYVLWERLKRYEDAEERGRLLGLPCVIGDTVYVVSEGMVVPIEVVDLTVSSLKTGDFIMGIICDTGNGKAGFFNWDFGKVVFFSEEQAEKALKEMTREVG